MGTNAPQCSRGIWSPQHSPSALLSAGNCLFFGCRQKSKDFYCQAEWEELVTKGFLTLFTAFSRDQVSSRRRRLDTEASQAALRGVCLCFWPLYLLAWPVKGLVGWHSGHPAPLHYLGADWDPPAAAQCCCPAGTLLAELSWEGYWGGAGEYWSR